LIRFGLIAAAFGGFFLYDAYDKFANYNPVMAQVTQVNTLCHLYKKISRKRSSTTNEGQCDAVRLIGTSDPQYEGYEVREKTHVSYTYSIDGKPHTSEHVQAKKDDGSAIVSGDNIEVLVSKTNADQTRSK
jgi:hypothetical protein